MKPSQVEVAAPEISFENAELQKVYETLTKLNKNYESLVDKLHAASQKISKVHVRKKITKNKNRKNGIE